MSAIVLFAQTPKFIDLANRPAATKAAVASLVSQGILQTRTPQHFAPDAPMTRAEYAVAMQKMFNLPQPAHAASFPDVPAGASNYAAVEAVSPHLCRSMLCFRCALIKNFLPNEPVSRAEMTMVLAHILIAQKRLVLLDESDTKMTLGAIADGQKIPLPARPYFAAAIKSGAVALEPGQTIALATRPTRAEMAEYLTNVQKKFSVPLLRPAR